MTTPTPSMQSFGKRLRAERLKEKRSEAAKKAWRTRRKNSKPSPAQRRLLETLIQNPRAAIKVLRDVNMILSVRLSFPDGSRRRSIVMNRTTWRVMRDRKWIEPVDREENLIAYTYRTTTERFQVSEKGRKAVEGVR